jgi:hypothetical protein
MVGALWWTRLRELADGLTRRAPGGCPGDPTAWEREYRRRFAEADAGHPVNADVPSDAPLKVAPGLADR